MFLCKNDEDIIQTTVDLRSLIPDLRKGWFVVRSEKLTIVRTDVERFSDIPDSSVKTEGPEEGEAGVLTEGRVLVSQEDVEGFLVSILECPPPCEEVISDQTKRPRFLFNNSDFYKVSIGLSHRK